MFTHKTISVKRFLVALLSVAFMLQIMISIHVLLFRDPCVQNTVPHMTIGLATLPTIYCITPTYGRAVQKAELTRLSHTFALVTKLHWIIVEDAQQPTTLVTRFVDKLKKNAKYAGNVTNLYVPTPHKFKLKPREPNWLKPKGVWQRNRGLQWLREEYLDIDMNGILYFADDDNTYDLELFDEMRSTRQVSVWPVGLVGGLLVERPLVSNGTVVGFNSRWKPNRPFPIDMAGFAIHMSLIMQKKMIALSADGPIGYIESLLLGQLVANWTQLEPKAKQCMKVLVWHTRTEGANLSEEKKLLVPSSFGLD